jgi:hypothetical protein
VFGSAFTERGFFLLSALARSARKWLARLSVCLSVLRMNSKHPSTAKHRLRMTLLALLFIVMPRLACAATADLTIEVAGELALHGGVITVYPLPVEAGAWPADAAAKAPATVRVEARYAEIQLRYPADGTFVYRFVSPDQKAASDRHPTHVLSIIGTDEKDQGPQMTVGFKGAYSSGGRTIRVPPLAEYAGEDEATRTNARWGTTEGRYPPPPADERSARVLKVIAGEDLERPTLACTGSTTVQVCFVPDAQWEKLTARWWRELAESRLERLTDRALRRCYDSSWLGGSQCDPDPASNEPQFVKRR